MRKFFLFVIICSAVFLGYSLDAHAVAPKAQVMVSDQDVDMDQMVNLEVRMTWPEVSGTYKFSEPEMVSENLRFDHESRVEETYMDGGRPWRRATLVYYFKPQAVGPASLKHIKVGYQNLLTQEKGTIVLARTVDFKIHPAQRAGLWLVIMVLVVGGVLAAGGFLTMWSSKKAGERIEHEHEIQERGELDAVLGKIQNATGASQKEVVFDWAKQFKIFVIHQYHLPKTLMTETDVQDAVKQSNFPQSEKTEIQELFERLSLAKFSEKDLNDADMHELQNDLIGFIKSKQVLGGS